MAYIIDIKPIFAKISLEFQIWESQPHEGRLFSLPIFHKICERELLCRNYSLEEILLQKQVLFQHH